jgi:homoserine/homoserine lactone efflux protein
MDLGLVLLFVATELVFSLSPGPAVFAVISASLKGGYRLALGAIFGVLFGNLIYFVVAAGLITYGALINESNFQYIKIMGVMYLAYIVYTEYMPNNHSNKGVDCEGVNKSSRSLIKFFLAALVMQLSNPKTILFFTAFLPQFVVPNENIPVQLSILAILSFVTEFMVLLMYAVSGRLMLKYLSKSYEIYLQHIGNSLLAAAVIWSLVR